jgi:hypothetical protein
LKHEKLDLRKLVIKASSSSALFQTGGIKEDGGIDRDDDDDDDEEDGNKALQPFPIFLPTQQSIY